APAENSVVAPGTVTFTGTANAGAKVQLVSNQSGNELGSAVAAADGTWSADVNRDLQAGTYIIVVKNGALQLDRAFTVK
ncbi:Ig-like domain-containing protein, partial [Leucobacter aridicollis]